MLFLVGGEYFPFNAEATMDRFLCTIQKIMKLLETQSTHIAEESLIYRSVKTTKNLQQFLKTHFLKFIAFLRSFAKEFSLTKMTALTNEFHLIMTIVLLQQVVKAQTLTSIMSEMADKHLG